MDSECLNLLQELQGGDPGGKCLSFDSPMGGDDDDIVAPVLVGSELVLVNDATRLCLGKIGETKVCLCLAQDCNVRSHLRNKLQETSLPGSRCLLVGSGVEGNRGFVAPALDASNFSETMIHSLLGRGNEDLGKTFELVAVEQIEDVDAEGNLLERRFNGSYYLPQTLSRPVRRRASKASWRKSRKPERSLLTARLQQDYRNLWIPSGSLDNLHQRKLCGVIMMDWTEGSI